MMRHVERCRTAGLLPRGARAGCRAARPEGRRAAARCALLTVRRVRWGLSGFLAFCPTNERASGGHQRCRGGRRARQHVARARRRVTIRRRQYIIKSVYTRIVRSHHSLAVTQTMGSQPLLDELLHVVPERLQHHQQAQDATIP